MSATDYLSTLLWGVADSGAYSAETTATLGTDRVDRREPPTAYHWSALQTSRMRQLLALMSAHFKGGSRVRIYPVTANPFSSGEMGTWIDSSASNALKYFNGTTNTTVTTATTQSQSDQSVLGAASTSSTTYVDVGNGTSTGFATWTAPASSVTKTYMLRVTVRFFMSTLGATGTTMFQVLQDGATIGGHPSNANKAPVGIASTTYNLCTFGVVVTQTAGVAHVYKLQWKVNDGAATANVSAGVGTLQMTLEG